jgi:hypothetical protein
VTRTASIALLVAMNCGRGLHLRGAELDTP